MNATSFHETPPQPSADGWEAYRAAAFAVIGEQERARRLKEPRMQEIRDASRDH